MAIDLWPGYRSPFWRFNIWGSSRDSFREKAHPHLNTFLTTSGCVVISANDWRARARTDGIESRHREKMTPNKNFGSTELAPEKIVLRGWNEIGFDGQNQRQCDQMVKTKILLYPKKICPIVNKLEKICPIVNKLVKIRPQFKIFCPQIAQLLLMDPWKISSK